MPYPTGSLSLKNHSNVQQLCKNRTTPGCCGCCYPQSQTLLRRDAHLKLSTGTFYSFVCLDGAYLHMKTLTADKRGTVSGMLSILAHAMLSSGSAPALQGGSVCSHWAMQGGAVTAWHCWESRALLQTLPHLTVTLKTPWHHCRAAGWQGKAPSWFRSLLWIPMFFQLWVWQMLLFPARGSSFQAFVIRV